MKSKYHIMLQYEHSQSSFLSIGCCADLEDLDDSANHYFFFTFHHEFCILIFSCSLKSFFPQIDFHQRWQIYSHNLISPFSLIIWILEVHINAPSPSSIVLRFGRSNHSILRIVRNYLESTVIIDRNYWKECQYHQFESIAMNSSSSIQNRPHNQ